ncbi:MAG: OFA family MFS transporter [Candidatus Bipolaricaulota bacterium]|nr:OFA family MFS transporter [Candidatus Bipolaricaulota bacterium]
MARASARERRSRVLPRWAIPGAGFVLALMGGVSYAWGSFVVPLTTKFGWTTAEATLPFTVFMVVFALGMVPAGRLQDRHGPRRVALAGAGVFLLAYLLASLVGRIGHPLWLVGTYGLLGGAGCALTYACVAPPARKWFPDRPGFAISLGVAGFGLAAVLFSPLKADHLIPAWGVEGTLLFLGLLVAGLSALAALVLRNPPSDWTPPVRPAGASPRRTQESQGDVPPREVVRSPVFYLIWGTFALVMVGGLMAIGLIKPYGQLALGLPAGRAAWAMSLFALLNGLGRPLAGYLGDRFGPVRVMIVTFAVQTVVFLSFPTVAVALPPYYAASALLGWGYAVTLALFPAVTAWCFGPKNLGMNYGLVFTAFGMGALGSVIGSWLYDVTGSYTPAFLLAGGTTGLGLLLAVGLKRAYKLP